MAEALGLAASVAGITSPAVQLGEGALKLKELHRKIRDAPATLNQAILGLTALHSQLQYLQVHTADPLPRSQESALVFDAMQPCATTVLKIQALVQALEARLKNRKGGDE